MEPTGKTPAGLSRDCPACGSPTKDRLFRQSFEATSGLTLLRGYDVVTCKDCGCGFADDLPSQDVFDIYYRDLSKYEYHDQIGAPSPYYRAIFRSFADLLEPLVPDRHASILDIGCATGGLLAELQRRGFANLLGIDPSPRCAQEAKRLYGIPVLTGSFFDLPLDGRQFDLLILTGVLEHVRDVSQMLGKIGRLLAPNGLLFIGVPDATRYMDGPNAPFQHFSMEHINYFSPTSLARLMSRHGWRPRTVHQMICNQNFATGEPFICALFQHDPDCAAEISFDNETEPALRSYIKHSQARMDRLHNILAGLATIGKPILVWGVGTHTLRLLATSPLANTPIRAFVDSNQNYQAKMLHGRPIIAPIDVKDYPEPILISSWMYQQEIQLQICKELCLPNEIILLYDLEPAENGRQRPANPD